MKTKIMMVAMLLALGGCFSACVKTLVDKGAQEAGARMEAIRGEQYKQLGEYLAQNGGDIRDFDKNADGAIDVEEMKSLPLVVLRAPTAPWWREAEFWELLLMVLIPTYGHRGIRRFLDARSRAGVGGATGAGGVTAAGGAGGASSEAMPTATVAAGASQYVPEERERGE